MQIGLLCAGVQVRVANDTGSLLWFEEAENITFSQAKLVNVGTSQANIISFTGSSNIIFDQLFSSSCVCDDTILASTNSAAALDAVSSFTVSNSPFTSSTAGALSIANSAASVLSTNIDNLVSSPTVAVNIANNDGSHFFMSSCSLFNNNASNYDNELLGTLSVAAANATIQDSNFTNNTAADGGAIYFNTAQDSDGSWEMTRCWSKDARFRTTQLLVPVGQSTCLAVRGLRTKHSPFRTAHLQTTQLHKLGLASLHGELQM